MAQVVVPAAQSVVSHLVAFGSRNECAWWPGGIGHQELAHDPRANAANVKPADLRLAQIEPVGQTDCIRPGAHAVLTTEREDRPAFGLERQDETLAHGVILRSIAADPAVLDRTAEPGKIGRDRSRTAATRMHAVIERVIDQRHSQDRTGAFAQRFAQIAARQQRIAFEQRGILPGRIILRPVNRDIVVVEGIARDC